MRILSVFGFWRGFRRGMYRSRNKRDFAILVQNVVFNRIFAFENLPEYHAIGRRVSELSEILDEVDSDAVGMCFDTGHAHMCGNVCDAVNAARRIIYIHASDNNGRKDEHLMPGKGNIDWDALSAAIAPIKYDGVFMLETFHSIEELQLLMNAGWREKLASILDAMA